MKHYRPSSPERHALRRRARGVATLTVVMVLFFVVSMVAAYTSRNLIFEQRTSANQYRSTQALEAADAGLQWALTLLNSGRIDTACVATTDPTSTTFRQRYLTIDASSGQVSANLSPSDGTPLTPSCVFNGTNWTCHCMTDGGPTVIAPAGTQVYPAFRVKFESVLGRTGIVRVVVNGCTRNSETCLAFPAEGQDNEGRATVNALFALKGGLTTQPAAPLTARGNVNLGGAALTAVNSNPTASGITVHAGGVVDPTGLVLVSAPGTPSAQSVFDADTRLAELDADRMFSTTFGMARNTYRDQPGAVQLACGGGCSAASVRDAIALSPGRVFWLQGDLNIDSGGDIGSATSPVVLVVTGNVTFSAAATVYGVIYNQGSPWNTSGAATIRGALMAEGNVGGSSTASLVYDSDVLTRLRVSTGSFVLVPGSWRDFQ